MLFHENYELIPGSHISRTSDCQALPDFEKYKSIMPIVKNFFKKTIQGLLVGIPDFVDLDNDVHFNLIINIIKNKGIMNHGIYIGDDKVLCSGNIVNDDKTIQNKIVCVTMREFMDTQEFYRVYREANNVRQLVYDSVINSVGLVLDVSNFLSDNFESFIVNIRKKYEPSTEHITQHDYWKNVFNNHTESVANKVNFVLPNKYQLISYPQCNR